MLTSESKTLWEWENDKGQRYMGKKKEEAGRNKKRLN